MGKRVLAFILTAAVVFGMPGCVSAFEQEPSEVVMAETKPVQERTDSGDLCRQDCVIWVNPFCGEEMAGGEWDSSPQLSLSASSVGLNSYSSVKSAAKYIRKQMIDRAPVIQFRYTGSVMYQHTLQNLQTELLKKAFAVTSSPQEGDYLRYHCNYIRQSYSYAPLDSEAFVKWEIRYNSGIDQERSMAQQIPNVVRSLKLKKCSDAQKIRKIYDYICSHTVYHDDGTWECHSAYAALENGAAVCQGYATLAYALFVQAGLKTRCISGTGDGQSHLWNIVKLEGKWYNLDATWDSEGAGNRYSYFLRGSEDFPAHTRDTEYRSRRFLASHPMSETAYTMAVGAPLLKPILSQSGTSVRLIWSRVKGASGYQICYSLKKNGNYRELANTDTNQTTSYTVSDLTPGKRYYFKVRAYSASPDFSDGSYSAVRSVKMAPPEVELSDVAAKKKALRIKWKTVENVSGYEIVLSFDKGGRTVRKSVRVKAAAKTAQAKLVRGLQSGRRYRVKVRAFAAGTKGRVWGKYSSAVVSVAK